MLTIHSGTRLQSLADALLQQFKKTPSENILAPELFVVQNYGMARWLSLYVAQQEGIAANLEFKFPAEIYWYIMRLMDSDIPEDLTSDRGPLQWTIFQILQNNNDPALAKLYQYVQNKDPQKQEMRCWQLAGRIADVFDQYLTYRPEMLLKWEQNPPTYSTGFTSERWQATLWNKLCKCWKAKSGNDGVHRATLQKKLRQSIQDGLMPGNKLPQRVTIFGVSDMPEAYIEMLVQLSTHMDIHFYLIDINQNEANPLIESYGHAGMEFKSLLWKHKERIKTLGDSCIEHIPNDIGTPVNFFEVFKKELISGESTGNKMMLDDSIQVHSCHSPRREVEVLYDQLLNLFNEDETLDPSDVLVLSPQMDAYAPIIDAVFGAPEQGIPEIPYHLSDSLAATQLINQSFEKLLDLINSRFKVTDVMDLLDFQPIRAAFSLTEDDISTLERWIGDNQIRWGIDSEHKNELGLPESNSFTWQAGLHRMMAGYAMDTKEDILFGNIYPYNEIQNVDHARLLGRFSQLLHHLFECRQKTKKSLSAIEWSELFIHWLAIFYTEDETFYRQVQWLREQFKTLGDQTSLADFRGTISFPIIKRYIAEVMEQRTTGGGRAGAGVTFSSLVQMHSIPFKIICMIGMDDGVFPVTKSGVEFDLITKYPQAGDRVQRSNDRQIFLETILAAERGIYFSYTGQSNRKEVEFPPSVVLRELIDYITDKYKIDIDKVTQKHRLHAFSPKYFQNIKDEKLFSFWAKNRKVAEQLLDTDSKNQPFISESLPEPDETFKQLTVVNLVSFFQHPARFLLQQRLDIYLREEKVLDEDREAFDLNNLKKYNLGQNLLNYYLANKSTEAFRKVAVAKDLIPENWPGEQIFDKQSIKVREFGSQIQQVLDQKKLEAIELDLQVDDFHIFGRLDEIYEDEQLLYRFGRMRPKDLIELWIKHLLFQLVKPDNHPGISRLYTRDKRKPIAFFQLPPVSNAQEILRDLLRLYWEGLQDNTLFFPNVSFAFAHEAIFKNGEEEDGIKNAKKEWVDTYRGYPKEGDDPYNKILMGSYNPLEHKRLISVFKNVSKDVWRPFFKVLNKDGGEV